MTIAEKWFNKLREGTGRAEYGKDLPLSAFRQVHVYVFEDGSGLIADTVSADCSIRVLDNTQVEHAKALNDAFGPDPWNWRPTPDEQAD